MIYISGESATHPIIIKPTLIIIIIYNISKLHGLKKWSTKSEVGSPPSTNWIQPTNQLTR
jgi:hypothetical protein